MALQKDVTLGIGETSKDVGIGQTKMGVSPRLGKDRKISEVFPHLAYYLDIVPLGVVPCRTASNDSSRVGWLRVVAWAGKKRKRVRSVVLMASRTRHFGRP